MISTMNDRLRGEVLQRIERDFGLQHINGTQYMRKGVCPACGQKELYTFFESPWRLICGRTGKCGEHFPVKDLYDDLFNDWSKQAPATEQHPNATARAYLEFARGFNLGLISGWFSQEQFFDHQLNIGSAAVRFALAKGGYWERLIDRPERFGKKKARFKPGESYKGVWWCPPTVSASESRELWIVEGIFDAIALLHHGIDAVAAMSCNAFPEESLNQLINQCAAGNRKLPKLVWALDNDSVAHGFTKRWVKQARKLGFKCEAALTPSGTRKLDWNDLHLRWNFIEGEAKRRDAVDRALAEARYQGALLISESASEKALLMYERLERGEFHFEFDSRLFWWKLDIEKYNAAMQRLEEDGDRELNNKQLREKALRMSGAVSMIANCYPEVLYKQSNHVTDETWFYIRINHPSGKQEKVTFTPKQLASAGEFKARLLSASGSWRGSSGQLDTIVMEQTEDAKVVETIDFIGYSKEHDCYVFDDVAVKGGHVYPVNAEDFFEFGKLRIKTLQKGVRISLNRESKDYSDAWFDLLWQCFGAQGTTALAFFFGSLFCEQIRAKWQSYLFLELTGEAGAGKTTLLNLLWKLLGRSGYEGFDPLKSTKAGRSRLMGQVSGMPVVFLEADRHSDDKPHAKTFEWDELKDFFGGGTLATKGVKNSGNETYEPPFRGSIVITQNAAVVAHEAIMTRIGKIHMKRPNATAQSRAAADKLNALDGDKLSHFLLKAVRQEDAVMQRMAEALPVYEGRLRRFHTHCISCGTQFKDDQKPCACGNALRGHIRVERIIKNHAQLLALVDCLSLVTPINEWQITDTQHAIYSMAIERQSSINADPPAVAEFWEVYDYLESLDEDGPVVNHSKKPGIIAINLNDFYERATEHRQRLADMNVLKNLLKESRSRKFIEANHSVSSAVRSYRATRDNVTVRRSSTIKCWIFQDV